MNRKGQETFRKSFSKKDQGQGAIEYLLIIAAAILVVAIVIIAVSGAVTGGESNVTSSGNTAALVDANLACQVRCDTSLANYDLPTGYNTCADIAGSGCS